MSDSEYVDLLTRADSALTAKQDRVRADFQLGAHARYDYDEALGLIVFSNNDTAVVVADVQFVGNVSRTDSAWHWAWDLPYVSPGLSAAARKARRYGWRRGVPLLKRTGWHADDIDGWEMTSLTAWIAGAEGAYRAPSSDSSRFTFMLLNNVRWADAGRTVDSYIISPRARE
jgi:hypothetical protein